MSDIIEFNGLKFGVEIEPDHDMREPWKEHDGHGIIREARANYTGYIQTRAGEKVLHSEFNRGGYVYDVRETLELARRDGWGLGNAERAALAEKLGREPTAREVTAEAVERDFQRMRAWCANEWHWVGVVVTLLDVDGRKTGEIESLWGIESDSGDYLDETAQELAEQLADRIGDAAELVKRTRIREGA